MIKRIGLGALATALVVAGRSATADNQSAAPPGSAGSADPAISDAADGHRNGHPGGHREHRSDAALLYRTKTPIKHLVVIFGENISFDHYFATYPKADNQAAAADGGKFFRAAPHTPRVNNLLTPLDPTRGFARRRGGPNLLTENPNFTNAQNGADAANPFRLGGPGQAATQDMGHNYKPEQQASDLGLMDLFPLYTGTANMQNATAGGAPPVPPAPPAAATKGLVMAYYDGNTVTAMWRYAQEYALNDNSWTTVFGPSTPGAINLISGQTDGIGDTNKDPATMSASHVTPNGAGGYVMIGDTDPLGDVCSTSSDQNTMKGRNIGDLLNARGITWGWFEGGFDLGIVNPNETTGCNRQTDQTVPNAPSSSNDYIPHHQPFQYYPSTANLTHARPSSVSAIGKSLDDEGNREPANHQYDSHDFFDALAVGNLPAVSYLKAPAYQDGHAGYSNPLDEQAFITQVVDALQATPEWKSTAIVLAYDDSDGWYDHQAPPIVNRSDTSALGKVDQLNGDGLCNSGAQQNGAAPAVPLNGVDGSPVQGRCGYGTRLPLLVISPYAKRNHVDHTLTDQTSVLAFIEDNWLV